jgi:hypothetical protein
MMLSIVVRRVPADICGVHSELIGDGSRSTPQLGSSHDEVLLTSCANSVEHEACTKQTR